MLRLQKFLAVLIFIPALLSAAGYEQQNIVTEEVRIPLRDGVKFGATLFRPDAEGKFPALVFRSPYGDTWLLLTHFQ